jgi:hypothetical protein
MFTRTEPWTRRLPSGSARPDRDNKKASRGRPFRRDERRSANAERHHRVESASPVTGSPAAAWKRRSASTVEVPIRPSTGPALKPRSSAPAARARRAANRRWPCDSHFPRRPDRPPRLLPAYAPTPAPTTAPTGPRRPRRRPRRCRHRPLCLCQPWSMRSVEQPAPSDIAASTTPRAQSIFASHSSKSSVSLCRTSRPVRVHECSRAALRTTRRRSYSGATPRDSRQAPAAFDGEPRMDEPGATTSRRGDGRRRIERSAGSSGTGAGR